MMKLPSKPPKRQQGLKEILTRTILAVAIVFSVIFVIACDDQSDNPSISPELVFEGDENSSIATS